MYQCSSCYSGTVSYSPSTKYSLDNLVSDYQGSFTSGAKQYGINLSVSEPSANSLESFISPKASYSSKSKDNSDNSLYKMIKTREYFSPNIFLDEDRPLTQFINDAAQINGYIIETFKITTGKDLPKNILINICSESDMMRLHNYYGGIWSPNIEGFAIHHPKHPKVFIKQGSLDKVMVTVGHELGHVLSEQLHNSKDEEAKAFAFSIAWIRSIKEHNIANLENSIKINAPAKNGLHNIALNFVQKLLKSGKNALELFHELANGLVSQHNVLF